MGYDNDAWDAIQQDTLDRVLKARIDEIFRSSEEMVRDHQQNVAKALLNAGVHLIPSEHLADHQFIVSRGVYEAAKTIGRERKLV